MKINEISMFRMNIRFECVRYLIKSTHLIILYTIILFIYIIYSMNII